MRPSLLLASNSPRRRQLLADAGFKFAPIAPSAVEKSDVDLTLRELTLFNATRKGLSVARTRPKEIVLSADTLVALDDQIIGKPRDMVEAAEILCRLSGRVHEVCSAVFVCHLIAARSTCFYEISRVWFRRLDDSAIRAYLKKVNPLDKAGSYAAQGHGAAIIEKIEGSYTNVVGLPMEKTAAALAEFGVKPKLA